MSITIDNNERGAGLPEGSDTPTQLALSDRPNGSIDSGRRYLRDFTEGERVDVPLMVVEHQLRRRKTGEPYLRLKLADRSGTVSALMWDGVEKLPPLRIGTVVSVTGNYEVHAKYGPQITIKGMKEPDGEVDPADFVTTPARDLTEMSRELDDLIDSISDPHLRSLARTVLEPDSDTGSRFRTAPAARKLHEAFRHGLLSHTLAVAAGVGDIAKRFAAIDRDIAVTGALLHDIGKIDEYEPSGLAYDQTDIGRLCGHIPLGYYMVRRAIEEISGFPEQSARQVLHILLSHHGTLENGSPVTPKTREASLVHFVDNLAGQQGSFDRVERDTSDSDTWSEWDYALGGPAFFPSRATTTPDD